MNRRSFLTGLFAGAAGLAAGALGLLGLKPKPDEGTMSVTNSTDGPGDTSHWGAQDCGEWGWTRDEEKSWQEWYSQQEWNPKPKCPFCGVWN